MIETSVYRTTLLDLIPQMLTEHHIVKYDREIHNGTHLMVEEGTAYVVKVQGLLGHVVKSFLDDADANEVNAAGMDELEAIGTAADLVYRVGYADADAVLMNWQVWVDLLASDDSIRRPPADGSGPVQGFIEEWPVVLCNELPRGKVLVGAFREYAMIRSYESQESEGNDARVAFYLRRPAAFTRITNFGLAA